MTSKHSGNWLRRMGAALILVLALSSQLLARPVYAGGVVGNGTPGSCTDAALAAAIVGGNVVSFNCGGAPHTIIVNTLLITPGTNLTVDGGGLITLDGENLRQIFYVQAGANLTLQHITLARADAGTGGAIYNEGTTRLYYTTIRNSNASIAGGAIHNKGTLVVNDSSFQSNSAGTSGGAIYNNNGTTSINRVTFANNTANRGAAIAHNTGTTTVRNSLLVGNIADTWGGGIMNFSGTVQLTNVTFSGNIANAGGGIYAASGVSVTLNNVTLHLNRADLGGAVYNAGGLGVQARNTILSNSRDRANAFASLNCDGSAIPVNSLGNNLATDNSCNLNVSSDWPNQTTFAMGPLANNGGPTQTHMLLPGSKAVNTGSACAATDQRGARRPVGPACDIGAVEYGGLWSQQYLPLLVR